MPRNERASVRSTVPWRAAVVSRRRAALCAAAASLLVVAGCGSGKGGPYDAAYEPMPREPMPVDAGADADGGGIDGAQCAAVIEQHPDEGHDHIYCTDPTSYQTDPPSSGNHYGCW